MTCLCSAMVLINIGNSVSESKAISMDGRPVCRNCLGSGAIICEYMLILFSGFVHYFVSCWIEKVDCLHLKCTSSWFISLYCHSWIFFYLLKLAHLMKTTNSYLTNKHFKVARVISRSSSPFSWEIDFTWTKQGERNVGISLLPLQFPILKVVDCS